MSGCYRLELSPVSRLLLVCWIRRVFSASRRTGWAFPIAMSQEGSARSAFDSGRGPRNLLGLVGANVYLRTLGSRLAIDIEAAGRGVESARIDE